MTTLVERDGKGVTVETESGDTTIVDPRESIVEYTTVFVETEGGGDETDPDLKVLIEGRVCEPADAVDGVPVGGVTVETEVVEVVIVDPSEFVVM